MDSDGPGQVCLANNDIQLNLFQIFYFRREKLNKHNICGITFME